MPMAGARSWRSRKGPRAIARLPKPLRLGGSSPARRFRGLVSAADGECDGVLQRFSDRGSRKQRERVLGDRPVRAGAHEGVVARAMLRQQAGGVVEVAVGRPPEAERAPPELALG